MLEQYMSIVLSSSVRGPSWIGVQLARDVGELLDEELVHLQPVRRVGVREQVVDHVIHAEVREAQRASGRCSA